MSSDECGNCHAELDNGRHICMSNFTVPSSEPIIMSIVRAGGLVAGIVLNPGDEIKFDIIEEGNVMLASDEDEQYCKEMYEL